MKQVLDLTTIDRAWSCRSCTFANDYNILQCAICDSRRSSDGEFTKSKPINSDKGKMEITATVKMAADGAVGNDFRDDSEAEARQANWERHEKALIGWSCDACTFSNSPNVELCAMCGCEGSFTFSEGSICDSSSYGGAVFDLAIEVIPTAYASSAGKRSRDADILEEGLKATNGKKVSAGPSAAIVTAMPTGASTDGLFELIDRRLSSTKVRFRLCFPACCHYSQTYTTPAHNLPDRGRQGIASLTKRKAPKQQRAFGARWSCGYRNIQMLCSALMQCTRAEYIHAEAGNSFITAADFAGGWVGAGGQLARGSGGSELRGMLSLGGRRETKDDYCAAMFGGSGRVPDELGELQEWLEKAWAAGYDTEGASHFDWTLRGTDKWVGATECAALLRYFGLRAVVVDFPHLEPAASSNSSSSSHSSSSNKRAAACWGIEERARSGEDSSGSLRGQLGVEDAGLVYESRMEKRLQRWMGKYFSQEPGRRGESGSTIRPPLYWQHQGHSRTIIGVQYSPVLDSISNGSAYPSTSAGAASAHLQRATAGAPAGERKSESNNGVEDGEEVSAMYVFDPSHSGRAMKESLERGNSAWLRTVRRILQPLPSATQMEQQKQQLLLPEAGGKGNSERKGKRHYSGKPAAEPTARYTKKPSQSLHDEYQIVYIAAGLMDSWEEKERAKTIVGVSEHDDILAHL